VHSCGHVAATTLILAGFVVLSHLCIRSVPKNSYLPVHLAMVVALKTHPWSYAAQPFCIVSMLLAHRQTKHETPATNVLVLKLESALAMQQFVLNGSIVIIVVHDKRYQITSHLFSG